MRNLYIQWERHNLVIDRKEKEKETPADYSKGADLLFSSQVITKKT